MAILSVVLACWLVAGATQTTYAAVAPPLSRSVVYAFGLAGVCVNAFFIYKSSKVATGLGLSIRCSFY